MLYYYFVYYFMEDRSHFVKYNINTFKILIERLLKSEDVYTRNKLVEMLTMHTFDSENLCKTIIDLSLGTILPEPVPIGNPVKINIEKVGWLATSEREIIDKNQKDGATFGIVIAFDGYHSYAPYKIGFPEGVINLPMEAVLDVSDIF